MVEYEVNVGQRLRALRESHGWTQDELADRAGEGIYRQYISRAEGSMQPKIELWKLEALAKAFGMTLMDFCAYLSGDTGKEKAHLDLKAFLLALGEVSPKVVDDIVAYYEFRKGQEK